MLDLMLYDVNIQYKSLSFQQPSCKIIACHNIRCLFAIKEFLISVSKSLIYIYSKIAANLHDYSWSFLKWGQYSVSWWDATCPSLIPWVSCQIRKIAGAHAPEMPGTFSPPPRVSDPDMHHGTCVTHVPWCMPGSLASGFLWSRSRGKSFPAFPAHAQLAILRIW